MIRVRLRSTRPRGATLLTAAAVAALITGCGGLAVADKRTPSTAAETTGPSCSTDSADRRYDAATRDDAEFNALFEHGFVQVDEVGMHYVEGGTGEQTLLLLHGWPSTWYEWREVMPELAEDFRVIAVDLPGLGDSEGAPPSYDKATMARYVTGLADQLGVESYTLAAHDFGAGVAYQVAVQQPERIEALIPMDFPLAGEELTAAGLEDELWHFAFHYQDDFPEAVVANDVEEYLRLFYPFYSPNPEPVGAVAITEAVRTYCRPDVLAGGFELYRTVAQDEADNTAVTQTLPMPVRYLGSPGSAGFEVGFQAVAPDLELVLADESVGHWIPEEDPEFVIEQIRDVALR